MGVRHPVTVKCPGSTPGVPATPAKSDGWTCNRCGACCSLVDCPHFLLTHWGDGGGVCGIYETRPAECRVPDVLREGAPEIVEFYCETCRFLVGQRKRWHDA